MMNIFRMWFNELQFITLSMQSGYWIYSCSDHDHVFFMLCMCYICCDDMQQCNCMKRFFGVAWGIENVSMRGCFDM